MNPSSTGRAIASIFRRLVTIRQAAVLGLCLLCAGAGVVPAQVASPLSTDELRARINELQNRLTDLQAKLPPLHPNTFLGGQVHGFVLAAVSDFTKFPDLMFLPDARVYLRNRSTGVPGPKVSTNDQGYFVTPNTVSGQYDVCVEAPGFAAMCDGTPVFITRGTVVLNHNIAIRPDSGFVTGQVLLRDGTPCYQENSMFQTYVYGKVELFDGANKAVAPAVRSNSYGYYVLPIGSPTGTFQLRASCDNGQADKNLTLVRAGGGYRADLTIPAATPQILSLTPTAAGHMVRTASPGDTLEVTAKAVDFNGTALHYRWADVSGATVTGTGAAVNWKLAPQGQMEMLYVEVTNGNGGYLRKHVALRTGDRSSLMSGTVIDSFTGVANRSGRHLRGFRAGGAALRHQRAQAGLRAAIAGRLFADFRHDDHTRPYASYRLRAKRGLQYRRGRPDYADAPADSRWCISGRARPTGNRASQSRCDRLRHHQA
jgi:hypothetical protein